MPAVSPSGITAGKAYVVISAIDNTKHTLGKVTRNLRAAAVEMQQIGRQILMGTSIAALGAALPIRQYAKFEDAMLAVRGKMGATSADCQKLTKLAQYLGETTSYTAQQVAESMVIMAQMGLKAGDITESIDGIMAGARATGTELPAMADYVLTAVRAFGGEFKDASEYADVMTAACNNSALTMEDLGQSLQYASSSGQLAGSSIREVTTLLAALANMGIRGTMAGTSLRRVYEKLALEREKLEGMGVHPFDDAGNYRPIAQIITELAAAIKDLPQGEKIALLTDIFEVRGMTGAAKLTQDNFAALAAAINDCKGVAAETAAVMDQGVGGALRLVNSAVERAGLAIGEAFRGVIVGTRDDLIKLVQAFTAWINEHQKAVVMTTIGIAATAALGAALIATGLAMRILIASLKGFYFVLGAITMTYRALLMTVQILPLTIAAATGAFHLTIAAVTGLYFAIKRTYTYGIIAFGAIKKAVLAVAAAYKTLVLVCHAFLASIVPALQLAWIGIKMAALVSIFAIQAAWLVTSAIVTGLIQAWPAVVQAACAAANIAWILMCAGMQAAWAGACFVFTNGIMPVVRAITTAATWIYQGFVIALRGIQTAIVTTGTFIKTVMLTTVAAIRTAIIATVAGLQAAWQGVVVGFTTACAFCKQVYTVLLMTMQMATASAVGAIRGLMAIAQQVWAATCVATSLAYQTMLVGMQMATVITLGTISALVRAFGVTFAAVCGAARAIYLALLIGFQIATASTSGIIVNLIRTAEHVCTISCAAAKYVYAAMMTSIRMATTTTVLAIQGLWQVFTQTFGAVCLSAKLIYNAMLAGMRTATVVVMSAIGGIMNAFNFLWLNICAAARAVYAGMLAAMHMATVATMAAIRGIVWAFSMAWAGICAAARAVYAGTLVVMQAITTATMAAIGVIVQGLSVVWGVTCAISAAIYNAMLAGLLAWTITWCLLVRTAIMGIPAAFAVVKGAIIAAFSVIPTMLASMTAANLAAIGLIAGAIALCVAFWPEIQAGIVAAAQGIASVLGAAFQYVIDAVAATGRAIWSTLTESFGQAWDAIKPAASQLWGSLTTDCMSAFNTISAQISEGDWTGAFETAVLAMRTVWSDFQTFFITAWHSTAMAFMNIWMSLRRGIQTARETMAKLVGWFMKIGMSKEEKAEFDKALNDVQAADRASMERGFTDSKTKHEKAIADAQKSNVSMREELAKHTATKDAELKAKHEQRIAEEATADAMREAEAESKALTLENTILSGATIPDGSVEGATGAAAALAGVSSRLHFTATILESAQRGTIEAERHFYENQAERRNALMDMEKDKERDKHAAETAKHTGRLVELAEKADEEADEAL
ncbi:MAG: phage tail tape measure protein [Thermoguttaceae bacterium]|nr:phage tail tape measure protein [Thermoguttaceae bacterium]